MNKETLIARQTLPLEQKVVMTQQRLLEFDAAMDGDVYVSFSGGKDSTVLAHIVQETLGDVPLVFCDTGMEYPEVRDFALSIATEVIKPKKTFKQVIEQHGYPFPSKEQARYVHDVRHGTERMRELRLSGSKGRSYTLSKKWYPLIDAPFDVSDYCCSVMKKHPFSAYEKLTGKKRIDGIMAEESSLRMNRYIANGGCNVLSTKRPHSSPMAFWTEQDVLKYISEQGIDIASVYGDIIDDEGALRCTGVKRTGCMFCMFGVALEKSPNRFELMRQTHPAQYRYCMDKLGCASVLDMFGIPR